MTDTGNFLDLAVLHDADLLQAGGDSAILDGRAVRGVFKSEFEAAKLGYVPTENDAPSFYLPEASAAGVGNGAILDTQGRRYVVVRKHSDGAGWVYLFLRCEGAIP